LCLACLQSVVGLVLVQGLVLFESVVELALVLVMATKQGSAELEELEGLEQVEAAYPAVVLTAAACVMAVASWLW
jgi:multisubunit Na+/H+ antiporter MnhC subunit